MCLNIAILFLALLWMPTSCDAGCTRVEGALVQIDVGGGQVFGVNSANNIYTLHESTWCHVPGKLQHVTVGPAGVWGVNKENNIFKLVAGKWVQIPGLLKQIDAGGDEFMAGVNSNDHIYCLNKGSSIQPCREKSEWTNIPGGLKYYSCGPISCWGVSKGNHIYIRKGVTPAACEGVGNYQHIGGALSMIEVGQDGSVYGVNHGGNIYHRTGITIEQPEGTGWTHIDLFRGQAKHVSFDLGHLWIILKNDQIYDCIQ
ncbi:fish-egg lectin-like [Engraulis encrasicolus]|uniref:fish-egg lectin-like n=1 Tax=Engraulis encrasicolus TaxID=184585 RepID=UPI002FD2A6A5